MTKWIDKFSLLPQAFARCLDAHATDVLHMSETRRQNQFRADVTRQDEERRSRSQELLNPDLPETGEAWNATQVAVHERLLPFGENLTTSMFAVASDLSEAQGERLASSLSLQVIDVTAYTFENVRAVSICGIFMYAKTFNG